MMKNHRQVDLWPAMTQTITMMMQQPIKPSRSVQPEPPRSAKSPSVSDSSSPNQPRPHQPRPQQPKPVPQPSSQPPPKPAKPAAPRPTVNRTVKPLSQQEFEEKRLRANPSYGSVQRGTCGLKNIGNTCFMNAVLQCLSATAPLTNYFLSGSYKGEVNPNNPLGTHGLVAKEYAFLVNCMWGGEIRHFSPKDWKVAIGKFRPQFLDFTQKDSQEFTSFMLDALHEDLNRVSTGSSRYFSCELSISYPSPPSLRSSAGD